MDKLRLRFKKTGRAIYISHLDLMHTFQRAFSRAGLQLKYSEGFNPHPQIAIALPLSVGASSVCEIMDFRLISDTELSLLPGRLNAALPEGIEVLEAYESEVKASKIKWLRIDGVFEYDARPLDETEKKLKEFFSADSIEIEKKTKRGTGISDIKPGIREISFIKEEGFIRVNALLSAMEPTINPELLNSALRQLAPDLAPDFAKFTRVEVYDEDMRVFR